MVKKKPALKDDTKVTIRFPDQETGAAFRKAAEEAGKRPSPFGAELIIRALTQPEQDGHELPMLRAELDQVKTSVKVIEELVSQLASHEAEPGLAEDLFEELQQIRQTLEQLAPVRQILLKLRQDIAKSVFQLLQHAGQVNRDQAEEFIRKHLQQE